jgi:hypothetical protein
VPPADAAAAVPPDASARAVAAAGDLGDPEIVIEPTAPVADAGSDAPDSRTATAPPRSPPEDRRPPRRPAPKKSDLEVAMAAERYTEAVAICKKDVSPVTASQCTIAACHLEQVAKARSWFAKIERSKRRGVTDACKEQGVDLAPVRAKPDPVDRCAADPMACQR